MSGTGLCVWASASQLLSGSGSNHSVRVGKDGQALVHCLWREQITRSTEAGDCINGGRFDEVSVRCCTGSDRIPPRGTISPHAYEGAAGRFIFTAGDSRKLSLRERINGDQPNQSDAGRKKKPAKTSPTKRSAVWLVEEMQRSKGAERRSQFAAVSNIWRHELWERNMCSR